MKRSLVSLAAMAVAGAASRQTVSLHGSASTELSLDGMRAHGYSEDEVQAAGRRRIEDAVTQQLMDLRRAEPVPRGITARTMNLQPWQEEAVRRIRELPAWSTTFPAHYGRI